MKQSDCPEPDGEGIGPRVSEWAEDRLSESRYSALSRITCSYCDGVLMLQGHLPSHYLRQVAQELVCRIDGVDAVVNQIRVEAARLSTGCESFEPPSP